MKVSVAEYAGFCFGVERAIKVVENAVAKNKGRVVTYGPLIHNQHVVKELQEKGVEEKSLNEMTSDMTAIIRTHGVPVHDFTKLKELTNNTIDATCPFVHKVQAAAKKYSDKGYPVVVVGEADHPEVVGIVSYVKSDCYVVSSVEEALKLPFSKSYGVVAQTTQNDDVFKSITEALADRCEVIEVSNTICSATYTRQNAAVKLAKEVDVMIVIGGKNSANTNRLYHLCKEICERTFHVESVLEVQDSMFEGAEHVGITAGASTPDKLIISVKEYILERANE